MAQNIVMYANINRNDFANIYKLIRCSFKMVYVLYPSVIIKIRPVLNLREGFTESSRFNFC